MRLTDKTAYGIVGNNEKVKNYPLYKVAMDDPLDYGITGQCFEKLADYEDAEEQGLLHKTPCKMGDTIYFIDEELGKVFQSIVARFWIAKLQSFVIDYDGRRFNFKKFGKTWFLDCEEAEAALAEKGGAE